jgi:predicted metal-dependent HD superfamily phosphohydrolase
MDADQRMIELMLKRAVEAAEHRLNTLETTTTRMSRHYNKLTHTMTMLSLLQELVAIARADPDHWDDPDESLPF